MPWRRRSKVSSNLKMKNKILKFFYFSQQLKKYLGSEVFAIRREMTSAAAALIYCTSRLSFTLSLKTLFSPLFLSTLSTRSGNFPDINLWHLAQTMKKVGEGNG